VVQGSVFSGVVQALMSWKIIVSYLLSPSLLILVRKRSALATIIFTSHVCLSVILSLVRSFCLFATMVLNISETRPDSGMVGQSVETCLSAIDCA